jgi:hypothetical protein
MNANERQSLERNRRVLSTIRYNLQTVVFRVDFHAGDFGCGSAAPGLCVLCVFHAFWLRPKAALRLP